MKSFAQQALEEYNSSELTTKRGGGGKPFWNLNSSQFMFAPQFLFPEIPGAAKYVYTATDSQGKTHSFEANTPTADLCPIWADIAVGFVTLTVEAPHRFLGRSFTAGTRTFYKTAPFPGREALPPKACSYKECAASAFRFVFEDPSCRYWLEHGKPDPEYYHNVYPSKTISSLVNAMIAYAELCPENKSEALKLATNAADYLLSITYGAESKLEGVPPTYSFLGLNKENVDKNAPAAYRRRNTVMMIYPASVGLMYLALEKATGDSKYFEAAKKIIDYYKKTVLPNGSWYLLVDAMSGKEESKNFVVHFTVLNFLHNFYERTKDEEVGELEKNYYDCIVKVSLENYNWEGQFEDIALSGNYQNLTHLNADSMIMYIAKNFPDNPEKIAEAEELMRFVEDQFVVWGKHAPWNQHLAGGDYWYSPAALEQYYWYVPIDGSTITVMRAFLELYRATKKPLLLEKACALADSITRMQHPKTGVIPTHWMWEDCTERLQNFWLNCHIGTAFGMKYIAEVLGEV